MEENRFYEVRCPNKDWKGNTKNYTCKTMCGKVTRSSMGEFWCRKCKILFNFIINDKGEIGYFNYEPSKKRVDRRDMTAEDKIIDLVDNLE